MKISPTGKYQTLAFFQIQYEGNTIICMYLVMVDLLKHKQDVELVLFCLYLLSTVVKVLCYKSEGRWFDPKWCHWNFSFTYNPSDRTMALGPT